MRGLITKETKKFEKFFALVQAEAKKKHRVFFLDCGQGKLLENELFECEDLCGWLIPENKADEFEKLFLEKSPDRHNFDDFFAYVDFDIVDDKVEIIIDNSPSNIRG